MKRYKPKMFIENPVTKEVSIFEDYRCKHPYLGEDHIRVTMSEDPQGEWVKWEDHKKESFRFTEIYEKRIRELKAKIGQECNCKEKYKEAWQWICSVHGYKRR